MPRPFSLFLTTLVLVLSGITATLPGQNPRSASIEVTATATVSPPALQFTWPLSTTATGYTVRRRVAGTTQWGTLMTIPGGGGATSWTDTNVVVGERYEYQFSHGGNPIGTGFLTSGIEADPIEDRGIIVLLVESSLAQPLAGEIDRLEQDLVGDGWRILRHDVWSLATPPTIRALIQADYNANPGEVEAVFVLGHVAVPYSGNLAPDGHSNHIGAWPADVYYADVDGIWTDTTVNNTSASRSANDNVPGDGKFDQNYAPSTVELAIGRVDLSNMSLFPQTEIQLLQQYLDKDHDYRHKVFTVDQRAVVDDNFGWFGGEAFAASGWRNFAALVGPSNTSAGDYFTTLNTTSGPGYAWSYGCGGGSYQSANGIGTTAMFTTSTNRCAFTMLFGSYFGDWDSPNNFLRAPLCSGWTLANAWAGRPHWSFHPMGLGQTLGYSARYTQNDIYAGGYFSRGVHVALMGDPTLRQHIIAPPGAVTVTDAWPQAVVSWSPSADPVAGYHVYRSPSPSGPFSRLTTTAVAGTSFADPSPLTGSSTYMVRALRLETVPAGSYWNLSQGAFATTTLPQQAAAHTAYGEGCYTLSDSFYELFTSATAAGLSGNAITMTPSNGGYVVSAGGTFVTPGAGATILPLGNDDQIQVTPSQPFPIPGGTTTSLHIHSNGIVAASPFSLSAPASALPDVAALLSEPATAWYSWHDYDPTEAGSGSISTEEAGGTFYVTWNAVESAPANSANPSTLQFQFELATGVVRIVWQSVTASAAGDHLVGFSPGGPSVDAGAVDLLGGLPLSVGSANLEALRLSASPAPVVTATTGTTITYTTAQIPAVGSGQHMGFTIFGFGPDLTGTSLASMGMPGCRQYLGTLDAFVFFSSASPTATTTLPLPAGFPIGTTFYAQALALIGPNSLPNGQNPFGAVTSNGIRTFVNDH